MPKPIPLPKKEPLRSSMLRISFLSFFDNREQADKFESSVNRRGLVTQDMRNKNPSLYWVALNISLIVENLRILE